MTFLLDVVYTLALIALAPVVLARAFFGERWRSGWAQRFGGVPRRKGSRPCVWIHAVSVGEANLIRPFVEALFEEEPGWDVVVSTFTNTGQKIAHDRYGDRARVCYSPLDLSWVLRRFFRRLRPDVIVLVELELWPNWVRLAHRKAVPILIVNGRMREAKVRSYDRLRWLWSPLRDPASRDLYCVQNETYADRFRRAGFPPERVRVTGTMKYDAVSAEIAPDEQESLREAVGLRPGERVWAGACTWPGEEAICLRVHRRLIEAYPDLRLILAPRHIERAATVEAEIRGAGFACRRRSVVGTDEPKDAVLLLDTVGELVTAYALTEAAFVGRSLTSAGGHNVLEPAALGVPVLFGPKTDNFADESRLLLDAGAATLVQNEQDLYNALFALLSDAETRRIQGAAGREAVRQRQGAVVRNLDALRALMPPEATETSGPSGRMENA